MAATTLVQQLQQVQQQRKGDAGTRKAVSRGKPSLLFDPEKAADIDVEAIHELGLQGKRREGGRRGGHWCAGGR